MFRLIVCLNEKCVIFYYVHYVYIMYIMCVCLFSALSRRVGALEISILLLLIIIIYNMHSQRRGWEKGGCRIVTAQHARVILWFVVPECARVSVSVVTCFEVVRRARCPLTRCVADVSTSV